MATPSVRDVVRRKLQEKQRLENDDLLQQWQAQLSSDGRCCEVSALTMKHSPFPAPTSKTPGSVLCVYNSSVQTYDPKTGPFRPVRVIIYQSGDWYLQCPVYQYSVIESGRISMDSPLDELRKLLSTLLDERRTLCPGILGGEVERLGYVPKYVKEMGGPYRSFHAVSCKVWHIPRGRLRSKSVKSDQKWNHVCTECLLKGRAVKRALKSLQNVDEGTKHMRRMPSSNYPWKYLSPQSKVKRFKNLKQQRTRLKRHVLKLYQRTKVELPISQSRELCSLIKGIESSKEGLKQLENIIKEGNSYQDKSGVKAGDCLQNVWQMDKESFFKDQKNNVTGKKGNRWSTATVRVALAVYNRSPSAYEALRGLKILELPCSKVLKKVIKEGAEVAGIDEDYFADQQKKFDSYKREREAGGHPLPLGNGVLMWDEVKVQMKVAWNMKGGGITGYTMSEEELSVLHDVFDYVVQSKQKASYIVQFLWRDLTSGYDTIGPYFPVHQSIDSNILQEFLMLSLKAFSSHGFRVCIVLCDGASSNLTLLKMLCGYERTALPVNIDVANPRLRYKINASFTNPEDPTGPPIFAMICPSHQLKNMIAALYSSRPSGSKKLTLSGVQFGWQTIEKLYDEEMQKAKCGLSRAVPGLKCAYVYRDNWTRLNVRPAKIMQQRYAIAAVKNIANRDNDTEAWATGEFLEACNLVFENGLLTRRRINSLESPVLQNIKKGMEFFERWCYSHGTTVYAENQKRARQAKFLAWQTWDLLRIVVYGFLNFCTWFFHNVSQDGCYFLSPLRINGSALESIFSVLRHTSGGNLSAMGYSPALGRLIGRKGLVRPVNKYSEKGYRDVTIVVDGTTEDSLVIKCSLVNGNVCQFIFPEMVAQSTIGGRQGSNACTIIAVKFGAYCKQLKLDVSLLWQELPQLWVDAFVNAICDGNEMYDQVYGDTAVFLDVDDVANSLGAECNVQSVSQVFDFTNDNCYGELTAHVSNAQKPSYGVLIGSGRSVGVLVLFNDLCALVDSHTHANGNQGGMILISNSPKEMIIAYSNMLQRQGLTLNIGTLTWVEYHTF